MLLIWVGCITKHIPNEQVPAKSLQMYAPAANQSKLIFRPQTYPNKKRQNGEALAFSDCLIVKVATAMANILIFLFNPVLRITYLHVQNNVMIKRIFWCFVQQHFYSLNNLSRYIEVCLRIKNCSMLNCVSLTYFPYHNILFIYIIYYKHHAENYF